MGDAREKIVFAATLVLVVALSYAKLSDRYAPARAPAAGSAEVLELANPPRVSLAGGDEPEEGERERPAFAPPRELLPMDPLDLPNPPRPRVSVARPAVTPAPLGVGLGADRVPADSLGALVLAAGATDGEESAGGYGFGGTNGPAGDPVDESDPVPEGDPGGFGGGLPSSLDAQAAPEDLYDWVERHSATRRHFGNILNDDPHGLRARTGEALMFQDVSLRTGTTVGVAYAIERTDVADFGLSRTFENKYLEESRGLSSGPGSVRSRMALTIDMLLAAGAEPRALEFAEREAKLAVEAGRKDPTAARLLAHVYAVRHDPESELAVYRDAVDGGYVSDALLCDYGRFVLREGLPERAAELLAEARSLRPVSAEVRTLEGLLLLDEGRAEEAAQAFRAADQVPFEPPFEERAQTALVLLEGRADLLAGRPAEALRAAERILLNEPADGTALHLAGAAHAALGQLEEAASVFGEALSAKPNDGELLTNAGIVAWRSGDGPGAVRLLEQAIDRDPLRAAVPMVVLGFLHEDASDPERARELYAMALQQSPGDARGLYRLGRNQRLQGDAEAAGQTLRRALRLAGPDVLLLSELGSAALDRGEPTLAARYFREGLRLAPGDAELLWLLGLSHLDEGDLLSAIDSLERATAAGAEGAHAALAVAQHRRGDADTALVHFDEVERAFAGRADDPMAAFAARQAAAVRDNLAKRQWVDRFGRSSLQRGWSDQQWDGSPRVYLVDDVVRIEGRMERPRDDEFPGIARSIDGNGFVSVHAELASQTGGESRYGMALTYRQVKGQQGRLPKARLEIWVDGAGQVRLTVLDNFDTLVLDGLVVEGLVVPLGETVRLGVERVDDVTGTFRFLVGGRPVGPEIRVKSLRGFKNLLDLEVFGEAPPGRQVDAAVSAVRIVRLP